MKLSLCLLHLQFRVSMGSMSPTRINDSSMLPRLQSRLCWTGPFVTSLLLMLSYLSLKYRLMSRVHE